jgi:hypothetical protein
MEELGREIEESKEDERMSEANSEEVEDADGRNHEEDKEDGSSPSCEISQ